MEDPERRLASLEARDCLRAAIAALPERQQAVLTLRDVEGLDADEVAESLDVSPGNQRGALHRARAEGPRRARGVLQGRRAALTPAGYGQSIWASGTPWPRARAPAAARPAASPRA